MAEAAPELLNIRPNVLEENIDATCKILNIDKEDFKTLVLQNPTLAVHRAELTNDYIKTNAKLLEISEDEYKGVCMSIPKMATMHPDKLQEDMNKLGLNAKEYVNKLKDDFLGYQF